MHNGRGRRAWRALALVGALALAGCTTTAGPTTLESSPPSPVAATPTPTPTTGAPAAPERPSAMDEADVAGAEALARYFLELYPYVYATGDLAEWKALSHPECVFCTEVVSSVETQVAAGNTNVGSDITIHLVVGREVTPGALFAVDLEATEGPSTEYASDGSVVESRPEASDYDVVFAITNEASGLVVREVDVVAKKAP
ncbi:hypothetical protein GXB85_08650 [Cellulomonas sp. APG4]|uniref:DUF6318 family protein n=1 Tax=Cellulomonas sp. APG4 TaxID=1538656 RepID=UPI00137B8C7F|nr:DUF6318 family protein [Cellulomonas sp. APG4]NCT91014.1 hypothetical protein [Cellulomonas sp. APG4]